MYTNSIRLIPFGVLRKCKEDSCETSKRSESTKYKKCKSHKLPHAHNLFKIMNEDGHLVMRSDLNFSIS